jgi:hypothetical protein
LTDLRVKDTVCVLISFAWEVGGVRSFNELKKRWDDHVSRGRHHPGLLIQDVGLVLGADTILVRMGETRSGAKALAESGF